MPKLIGIPLRWSPDVFSPNGPRNSMTGYLSFRPFHMSHPKLLVAAPGFVSNGAAAYCANMFEHSFALGVQLMVNLCVPPGHRVTSFAAFTLNQYLMIGTDVNRFLL